MLANSFPNSCIRFVSCQFPTESPVSGLLERVGPIAATRELSTVLGLGLVPTVEMEVNSVTRSLLTNELVNSTNSSSRRANVTRELDESRFEECASHSRLLYSNERGKSCC